MPSRPDKNHPLKGAYKPPTNIDKANKKLSEDDVQKARIRKEIEARRCHKELAQFDALECV